jgi:hypothetical protein
VLDKRTGKQSWSRFGHVAKIFVSHLPEYMHGGFHELVMAQIGRFERMVVFILGSMVPLALGIHAAM